jgi:hypothetical protein
MLHIGQYVLVGHNVATHSSVQYGSGRYAPGRCSARFLLANSGSCLKRVDAQRLNVTDDMTINPTGYDCIPIAYSNENFLEHARALWPFTVSNPQRRAIS